jgi:pilus assembly protein CpaC
VAVQMEDGQTLAIGGLISHTVNASMRRVPILGDLPFVGVMFNTKNYDEREEEMIILVTPRLVDPMACCQLPKYLPGQETRSPDDFEFFLEGLLEAPRGPRHLGHGTGERYKHAYLNGETAGMYPCHDMSRHDSPCSHLGGHGNGCHNGACYNGACQTGNCAPAQRGPVTAGMYQMQNEGVEYVSEPLPTAQTPIIREMPATPSAAPMTTQTVPSGAVTPASLSNPQ